MNSDINFNTSRKRLDMFSMAGLTDIVLLLLIFFLLTSSFIPQFGVEVNLPRVESVPPVESQSVTVTITNDGRYFVNQTPTPEADLLMAVDEARGEGSALIVRGDAEAVYGQVVNVMTIGKALDLRVVLATELPGTRQR